MWAAALFGDHGRLWCDSRTASWPGATSGLGPGLTALPSTRPRGLDPGTAVIVGPQVASERTVAAAVTALGELVAAGGVLAAAPVWTW
jgi:hypothetical protein